MDLQDFIVAFLKKFSTIAVWLHKLTKKDFVFHLGERTWGIVLYSFKGQAYSHAIAATS
jgi:hypothetical protein